MSPNPPQLPALYDTTYTAPAGPTVHVPVGGNLQTAFNNALPDSTITLDPAGVYSVNLTLPVKSGAGYIHIRSSNPLIPSPGTRVSAADFAAMPKIVGIGTGGKAFTAAPSSHHYRFIGIEVYPGVASSVGAFNFGTGVENSASLFPHHIIVDRCYVHGRPGLEARRGVMLCGSYQAVIDSYISDWKSDGSDTQAVSAWTGYGPYKIVNCYLESAGENVMIGGVDPKIANLVPQDIEIRGNLFSKPLSWNPFDPSYAGAHWTVKNLIELKNAQRVLIEDNLFQRCWVDAQNGQAILFSTINQSNTAPWSIVQDITFRRNTVRGANRGLTYSAKGTTNPTNDYGRRVLIENNLFDDLGSSQWSNPAGQEGTVFGMYNGGIDVEIAHNTINNTHGGMLIWAVGASFQGFIYRDNVSLYGSYGILGNANSPGNPTIATYFPGGIFAKNVIVWKTGVTDPYPANNFYPPNVAAVGFVNYPTNLQLSPSSPYYNAGTDGNSPGVIMPKTLQVSNVEFDNVGGGTYTVKAALVNSSDVVVALGISAPVVVPPDPDPVPTATTPTVTVS
jgi:hypothetical protein